MRAIQNATNWREAFPCQTPPATISSKTDPTDTYKAVFILSTKYTATNESLPSDVNQVSLSITKEKVTCTLTESELIDAITKDIKECAETRSSGSIDRARDEYAVRSQRGFPNTQWGNYVFYKGESLFDAPFVIAEENGLFGYVRHPKARDYGFIVES